MKRSVVASVLAVALASCLGGLESVSMPNHLSKEKSQLPISKPKSYLTVDVRSLSSGLETGLDIELNEVAVRELSRFRRVWYEVKGTGVVYDIPSGVRKVKTNFKTPMQLDGCPLVIYGTNESGTHMLYHRVLGQYGN